MSYRTGSFVAKGSELEWQTDDDVAPEELESQPNAATVVVDHDDTSPVAILAADATCTRRVCMVAKCTESLAGDTPPTFDVGWTLDPDGILDQNDVAGASAGDVFVATANLPAGQPIICTVTAGSGGTPAGKLQVSVLAVPYG